MQLDQSVGRLTGVFRGFVMLTWQCIFLRGKYIKRVLLNRFEVVR